ncbi:MULTISPECIES: hypothetical protein [Streptomyces]|uniref:hypothetical protein n=1 Tax=Streptomyces lycopersici TaxID=2974589 RepID=UPI0021D209E4|nr:hypothetical protein [Streptomyces sp. NEAU-383]
MTNVSAVPENLKKYSAACTWGAQDFQNWVHGVLTPALQAYESTGGCRSFPNLNIDSIVAVAISKAYYNDRDVDTVARAFQQTQHGGALGAHQMVWARDSDINSAFNQLQQQNRARMLAGAALAKKLMALQPPDEKNRPGAGPEAARPILQELAKHAKDPYFCAGFYNSLDAPHLDTALALGGIPALVTAYSTGAVSPETTKLVAMRIGAPAGIGGPQGGSVPWHHISNEQKAQLLDAFAANPSASYQFSKSLTARQVREMFYGDRQYSPKVMKILTLGMSGENSPGDARDLMHKVSIGLFGDGAPKLDYGEWKKLGSSVSDFYNRGVLQGISAPTDFHDKGLESWEAVTGTEVGQDVGLFLRAMHEADPDNKLVKSMMQGGYVNVMFMPTSLLGPEGIAFTAAVGALQSVYSSIDPITTLVDKAWPDGKQPDTYELNKQFANAAFSRTLSMLVARRMVHDRHGKLVTFGGDKEKNEKTLENMLRYDDYRVGKDKVRISELASFFVAQELDEQSRAVTQPDYAPPYE